MKSFSRTIAVRVFFGIAAMDAVLMVLGHLTSDSVWVGITWWIVNFPGFPLVYILLPVMPMGLPGVVCTLICAGLFSAFLWSAIAGYIFRHKYVA